MSAASSAKQNDPGRSKNGQSSGRVAGFSSRQRYADYLRRYKAGESDEAALGAVRQKGEKDKKGKAKRSRPFWTLLREFWAMLGGHRWRVGACVMTVTLSALVALLTPASTKLAIDYVLTDHPGPSGLPSWLRGFSRMELLWLLSGGLMTAVLLTIGVGMWGRMHMTRLTKKMQARVRRRVFNHAVRLPLHRVYQIKSGGAASILREDAGNAAQLLFSLLYNPWRAIVQLTGTLAILAWTDWRLLAAGAVLIPFAWFSQRTWISRIRPVFRDVRNTRQQIDGQATEAFGGMRIVRAFSRQRGEAARFIRSNHLLSRQELLAWWWSRTIEIVWMVFIPLASCGVLIYGGHRIFAGQMTIGDLMMFSAYLLMLLGPLESLTSSATDIQSELAGLDRVLDLLEEPVEFENTKGTGADGDAALIARRRLLRSERTGEIIDRASVQGRISLRGVSFRYPGSEEWVLQEVDLEAPAGSTVALVGPSGAGKTTLCNLVARFYDPVRGVVELDGRDLKSLDVSAYRALLGVVEQDVFLFDGTVRENIGYARRRCTPGELENAARAASAHEFIMNLERGYDTLIGERGVRLSGGQKQRIAIARALLADPRILILDEATSNLDSESEALIQQSLRTLMRGRTCFVIAHRLSTIRHADLIVVIEKARIIERGSHEALVASEGRYWSMLQRQLARPDDQAPVVAGA